MRMTAQLPVSTKFAVLRRSRCRHFDRQQDGSRRRLQHAGAKIAVSRDRAFVLENAVVDAESAIPATKTTVMLDGHVDLSRHQSPEWRMACTAVVKQKTSSSGRCARTVTFAQGCRLPLSYVRLLDQLGALPDRGLAQSADCRSTSGMERLADVDQFRRTLQCARIVASPGSARSAHRQVPRPHADRRGRICVVGWILPD